jgi:hypothetical protein
MGTFDDGLGPLLADVTRKNYPVIYTQNSTEKRERRRGGFSFPNHDHHASRHHQKRY